MSVKQFTFAVKILSMSSDSKLIEFFDYLKGKRGVFVVTVFIAFSVRHWQLVWEALHFPRDTKVIKEILGRTSWQGGNFYLEVLTCVAIGVALVSATYFILGVIRVPNNAYFNWLVPKIDNHVFPDKEAYQNKIKELRKKLEQSQKALENEENSHINTKTSHSKLQDSHDSLIEKSEREILGLKVKQNIASDIIAARLLDEDDVENIQSVLSFVGQRGRAPETIKRDGQTIPAEKTVKILSKFGVIVTDSEGSAGEGSLKPGILALEVNNSINSILNKDGEIEP